MGLFVSYVETIPTFRPGPCHSLGGYSPASHHCGPGSFRGWVMWDLWRTRWHCRWCSPSTWVSPAPYSLTILPPTLCSLLAASSSDISTFIVVAILRVNVSWWQMKRCRYRSYGHFVSPGFSDVVCLFRCGPFWTRLTESLVGFL
jgi:hypothetical protein